MYGSCCRFALNVTRDLRAAIPSIYFTSNSSCPRGTKTSTSAFPRTGVFGRCDIKALLREYGVPGELGPRLLVSPLTTAGCCSAGANLLFIAELVGIARWSCFRFCVNKIASSTAAATAMEPKAKAQD